MSEQKNNSVTPGALVGYASVGIIAISGFMPWMSMPLVGSITLMKMDLGPVLYAVVVLLGVLSAILAPHNKVFNTIAAALAMGATALPALMIYVMQSKVSQIAADATNDFERGLAASVGMGAGAPVMAFGCVMLMVACGISRKQMG